MRNCDIIPVRETDNIRELSLKYHPRAIIQGAKQDSTSLDIDAALPVIQCTLPALASNLESLGIAGYLSKPVTMQGVLEEIQRVGDVQDILVIDDDRGFTLLIERILKTSNHPYQVRRAYDGVQGLSAINMRPPDLILLDLIMPGLDGLGMLTQIRADTNLSRIPVLLLTSHDHTGELQTEGQFTMRGLSPNEILNSLSAIVGALPQRFIS
jgi:CheY-like chemotaxis protein